METVVSSNSQFQTGRRKVKPIRKKEPEAGLTDLPEPVLNLVRDLFLKQGRKCRIHEFDPQRSKGSKWRRLSLNLRSGS